MRDGQTKQLEHAAVADAAFEEFMRKSEVLIVVLSGDDAGSEYAVERPRVVIGRGDSADLRFGERAMSSEHAAVEFAGSGFRIRDLGSRNGTLVNGADVKAADLKSGDRFEIGGCSFQFVVTPRTRPPRTHEVPIS
jgi:pSer/pThr/pTyr-binding forkhead associated (FHA) protein